VRVGHPVAPDAVIEAAGIRLRWPRPCASARYSGRYIAWGDIRDADPSAGALAPELRLRDGRTVFFPARMREDLRQALERAGVPVVERPHVWPSLLEPFLDSDYGQVREPVERQLAAWGLERDEVRRIRRRVLLPMALLGFFTSEWIALDQVDLLCARFFVHLPPQVATWPSYRRFRSWTDEIADRPVHR
jgi:hypothetical protein